MPVNLFRKFPQIQPSNHSVCKAKVDFQGAKGVAKGYMPKSMGDVPLSVSFSNFVVETWPSPLERSTKFRTFAKASGVFIRCQPIAKLQTMHWAWYRHSSQETTVFQSTVMADSLLTRSFMLFPGSHFS